MNDFAGSLPRRSWSGPWSPLTRSAPMAGIPLLPSHSRYGVGLKCRLAICAPVWASRGREMCGGAAGRETGGGLLVPEAGFNLGAHTSLSLARGPDLDCGHALSLRAPELLTGKHPVTCPSRSASSADRASSATAAATTGTS
jgi:hypothetical protein